MTQVPPANSTNSAPSVPVPSPDDGARGRDTYIWRDSWAGAVFPPRDDIVLGIDSEAILALREENPDLRVSKAKFTGAPLPQRLLLRHSVGTRAMRANLAQGTAMLYAFFGIAPAFLLMYLMNALMLTKLHILIAGALTMLLSALWGYWNEISDAQQLYDEFEWIDFERRLWRSHKSYEDAGLPAMVKSIPLDALMVLCHVTHYEQGVSYDCDLIEAGAFDPETYHVPLRLYFLHMADEEDETLDVAKRIATLWRIPCWSSIVKYPLQSERLC